MEIAPRVHAVPLLSCTGFLAADDRLTLIDAGFPGSRRRLERYLAAIGRSIDELDAIICTHAHPDHIGGLAELVRASGARVVMHRADIEMARRTLREAARSRNPFDLIAAVTRVPGNAVPIDDGDELGAFGGLRVIHTPGHTPGSVCLYSRTHRLLFVGDALQVIRGRVTYASAFFSRDLALAKRTLGALAGLDVETIAFSHYPPWRDDPRGTLERLAAAGVAARVTSPQSGRRAPRGRRTLTSR